MGTRTAVARAVAKLRDAEWLTAKRARAWCRVLAAVTVVVVFGYLVTSQGGIDRLGKPLGTDFVSFWTAARLALASHPASGLRAYDATLHESMQHTLFPVAQPGYFAFFYPPTFLLLCLPLAALPYLVALTAWLTASFMALYACLRRLLPHHWAIIPIFVFPGTLVNAGNGQNGVLTAACFGWSMVLSRRHPFLAGACLGLLVIKPHLLLAAPVVLLTARRWAMIAGSMTSGFALGALSWLILGGGAWGGFLRTYPLASATLEQGLVEPWKMQSVFATTRLLHGGLDLAYALQATFAIGVCVLLARIAIHRPGTTAESAILIAATPLCTPFLLDYDLACLALPIAWVAAEAQRTGWRAWEKIVLLTAYILPVIARPLAMTTGISIAPVVMVALLLIVAHRAAVPE